jgi:hypothetical protein
MTRPPTVLSECPECAATVMAVPTGQQRRKMEHAATCELAVTRRWCEWCGGPMKENAPSHARTCKDRCRAAMWKWEKGYGTAAPRGSVRTGRAKPSGLQVSYRKAVAAVAAHLQSANRCSDQVAQLNAEHLLSTALSEKQRARLDGDR